MWWWRANWAATFDPYNSLLTEAGAKLNENWFNSHVTSNAAWITHIKRQIWICWNRKLYKVSGFVRMLTKGERNRHCTCHLTIDIWNIFTYNTPRTTLHTNTNPLIFRFVVSSHLFSRIICKKNGQNIHCQLWIRWMCCDNDCYLKWPEDKWEKTPNRYGWRRQQQSFGFFFEFSSWMCLERNEKQQFHTVDWQTNWNQEILHVRLLSLSRSFSAFFCCCNFSRLRCAYLRREEKYVQFDSICLDCGCLFTFLLLYDSQQYSYVHTIDDEIHICVTLTHIVMPWKQFDFNHNERELVYICCSFSFIVHIRYIRMYYISRVDSSVRFTTQTMCHAQKTKTPGERCTIIGECFLPEDIAIAIHIEFYGNRYALT